ncbi:MAG: SusC/RagA family TonB-linked outer membrane protein [Ferruginibacter sp.]|nr:SusC/RagA family TonB-linked outer membrane protein [Ferruginibacter sp.]
MESIYWRSMKVVLASLLVLTTGTLSAQVPKGVNDTITISRELTKSIFVTGKITDAATNKGASGVRLQVEGFSAAITDSNGLFRLKVPSYESTIFINGEGYNDREVPLKGRHTLAVALLDDSHESFNEVVTMPMGRQSKKSVTALVGQYNLTGWSLNTAETPDALLQGRIAGLNVTRRSGSPGAGANLLLRGYNSLYATNKPLIVIDNMLYDANDYGQSLIANNYTNPLALIDVKDIDNITVVKDASSLYGSKGANGAIIITTARAKELATRIDFGAYTGFNFAPKSLPVMQAGDYRTYLSDILQSQGMSSAQIAAQPYMNDDPANADYASYHFNTDWQKEVFKNSVSNNYFLKVTGGDNIATYGLSMGFMKNQGVVRSTDISRFNMRFNAEFNFSKRFTGFTNLSFGYNEQNLKDQGIANKTSPVFVALVKAPFLNVHEVNSQGIESPNLADRDILGISNPSAIIEKMLAYNKYYRFYGAFGFKYEINKNLSANTILGVMYDKVRENIFVPSKGIAKDTLSNAIAIFLAGNSTVVDQDREPWAAWGQMIPAFFKPGKVAVANYAESGETLKGFKAEKRLEKIWSMAKPGDYLFIEFTHNDQKPGGNYLEANTTYKQTLTDWITEARKRDMIPVLVTSMHRRNFDSTGHIINTLGDYPEAARQTAKAENAALVDLNAMSKILYEAWGSEQSVKAFVHYPAHTFPGQDQELKDNTHFSTYGAFQLAKCVVLGIQKAKLPITNELNSNAVKFDPAVPDDFSKWYWPLSPLTQATKPDGN